MIPFILDKSNNYTTLIQKAADNLVIKNKINSLFEDSTITSYPTNYISQYDLDVSNEVFDNMLVYTSQNENRKTFYNSFKEIDNFFKQVSDKVHVFKNITNPFSTLLQLMDLASTNRLYGVIAAKTINRKNHYIVVTNPFELLNTNLTELFNTTLVIYTFPDDFGKVDRKVIDSYKSYLITLLDAFNNKKKVDLKQEYNSSYIYISLESFNKENSFCLAEKYKSSLFQNYIFYASRLTTNTIIPYYNISGLKYKYMRNTGNYAPYGYPLKSCPLLHTNIGNYNNICTGALDSNTSEGLAAMIGCNLDSPLNHDTMGNINLIRNWVIAHVELSKEILQKRIMYENNSEIK